VQRKKYSGHLITRIGGLATATQNIEHASSHPERHTYTHTHTHIHTHARARACIPYDDLWATQTTK